MNIGDPVYWKGWGKIVRKRDNGTYDVEHNPRPGKPPWAVGVPAGKRFECIYEDELIESTNEVSNV